ncbi:acyl-CoA reductase [Spongiactinospora sp. TRM90649]|uniref:acyl-CoA reductase n=1 Tax=Spongiactinospora sp. TRM90649 TaxID=3031114 RepID=UPI0023F917C5|nr:acyl-CoA reductase [Spongiactinospora sp. TRM90649]MDF5751410.1 acyl-CoA reductase [Spongiactinospora sp. TRM90649]
MNVRQVFPPGPDAPVRRVAAQVREAPPGGPLTVGDERIRAFLESVSRRLVAPAMARRHPELTALGYFLRRSEVTRVLARLRPDDADPVLRVPRGLVFHIPPANVDTLFVYSWALSALAGNHNVVRLSPRAGGPARAVVEVLLDALADAHPAVAHSQRVVGYERSTEATGCLSAACDLRVIWGGDEAVREIRRQPLPPHARDVTFPDRSSFAVIRTSAWLSAPPEERERVVTGFANDAYWFGQAACASPRTVFWVGSGDRAAAAGDFNGRLTEHTARRWRVDAAMAVRKRVAAYGLAADGVAGRLSFPGNEVTVLELPEPADPAALPRRWLGAGVFAHTGLGSLDGLLPLVDRKDQTMTHYGFERAELRELAEALAGRGIDRMVPIGSALRFDGVWDGVDLPVEFTRLVSVAAPGDTGLSP